MVESQSLQLVQQAASLQDAIVGHITQQLVTKGYDAITPSLLSFLSVLDCGVNHGSEIARTMGVSRQMVAKIVKELCQLGYLEQASGKGKQKDILFTRRGEQLISDARELLAELDQVLCIECGDSTISSAIKSLSIVTNSVSKKLDNER